MYLITILFVYLHINYKEHYKQLKLNLMKTIITLTTILTLIFSGLLISGLNNYNNAIEATQKTNGSDLEISDTMCNYGFNLDVFETPTVIDYIKSNFNN